MEQPVGVVSEPERARMALGDILVKHESDPEFDEGVDEAALFAEIDAAMQGKPNISDVILEERREGP